MAERESAVAIAETRRKPPFFAIAIRAFLYPFLSQKRLVLAQIAGIDANRQVGRILRKSNRRETRRPASCELAVPATRLSARAREVAAHENQRADCWRAAAKRQLAGGHPPVSFGAAV